MNGITLREIAARANVSVNTVSRALNGKPEVAVETREKILLIARELGYLPAAAAKAPVPQTTGVIGVVVSDNVNPYFAEVIRGISFVAQAHGWTIFLVNTYLSPSVERAAVETLARQRVSGLIIFPVGWDQVEQYMRYEIPVVMAGARIPEGIKQQVDVVAPDDRGGAREAVEYLVRSGRRKIYYCGPHVDSLSGTPRWESYVQVMQEAGLEPALLPTSEVSAFAGYRMGMQWQELADADAVFAFNDLLAFGLMRALAERGARVPSDIAVVGYDDVEFARYTSPSLTTVRIPKETLGQHAATLLLRRIQGDLGQAAIEKILPTQLIIRESA